LFSVLATALADRHRVLPLGEPMFPAVHLDNLNGGYPNMFKWKICVEFTVEIADVTKPLNKIVKVVRCGEMVTKSTISR
jgi:hypothetical protein